MANTTLNVRIKNRYDTEANWSSNNPVLLNGELAISSDKNGMYKVGNGTSTWSELSYNNANSANSATRATQDSAGQQINTTYIKALSVSGKTITYTKGDGTTGTITTQDTNTDTKNTAGSTDTSSKIYLIGATSQAANPQTYSQDTAYVGTNGCLYSGGNRVTTEIISEDEPSGQTTGDFWMLAY